MRTGAARLKIAKEGGPEALPGNVFKIMVRILVSSFLGALCICAIPVLTADLSHDVFGRDPPTSAKSESNILREIMSNVPRMQN